MNMTIKDFIEKGEVNAENLVTIFNSAFYDAKYENNCSVEILINNRVVPTTERSKVQRLLFLMCGQKERRQLRNQRAGISGLSRPRYQL